MPVTPYISIALFFVLLVNLTTASVHFKYFDNATADNLTLAKFNISIPSIGNLGFFLGFFVKYLFNFVTS